MIRLSAAVITGKIINLLCRIGGFKGTSVPGKVSHIIDPAGLRKLASQVCKGIIVVCGTNGKTTTANMITAVLQKAGYRVIANSEGANMNNGVTTAFISSSGLLGRIRSDYAVIEIDEGAVPAIMQEVAPHMIVVTNFFQDQLDRYGEPNRIIDVITDSLIEQKQATLVLNGDDPLVSQLAQKTALPAIYYGMSAITPSDAGYHQGQITYSCPICGGDLQYQFYHYGQLGAYCCLNCSFTRPKLLVEAREVVVNSETYHCQLTIDRKQTHLSFSIKGSHNIFNALAAIAACMHLGINIETILYSIKKYKPVKGRMEEFNYKNKMIYLNLVKNSAGFNETLASFHKTPGTADIFIAINDNDADGKDVSWLWDVDFEMMTRRRNHIHQIICSGKRSEDVAVRLKYAGVPEDKIILDHDLSKAVKNTINGNGKTAYLFPNYTLLQKVHEIVRATVRQRSK